MIFKDLRATWGLAAHANRSGEEEPIHTTATETNDGKEMDVDANKSVGAG